MGITEGEVSGVKSRTSGNETKDEGNTNNNSYKEHQFNREIF